MSKKPQPQKTKEEMANEVAARLAAELFAKIK